jgi:hypothetical protein
VHTTREPRSDVPATNGDHAPVYAGCTSGADVDHRSGCLSRTNYGTWDQSPRRARSAVRGNGRWGCPAAACRRPKHGPRARRLWHEPSAARGDRLACSCGSSGVGQGVRVGVLAELSERAPGLQGDGRDASRAPSRVHSGADEKHVPSIWTGEKREPTGALPRGGPGVSGRPVVAQTQAMTSRPRWWPRRYGGWRSHRHRMGMVEGGRGQARVALSALRIRAGEPTSSAAFPRGEDRGISSGRNRFERRFDNRRR